MAAQGHPYPIVGVGASAGGVEALEGLFSGLADDSGCGFVVVTHLSPDRHSMLPEILGRYTRMPVRAVEDGGLVGPNEVHVLAADAVLDIRQRRLRVRPSTSGRRERKPIDVFFSALAADQGDHAVGVILSGGDGDGALGIKAIKERGGLTLAQMMDGHGPQHSGMPETAIATGMVDIVSPVEAMGPRLADFARRLGAVEGMMADERAANEHKSVRVARQEICAVIRDQLGHDFSGYKEKSFLRRVERRMQVNQIVGIGAYVERLRSDPKEVHALFRDLLINVTNFFRDADAFKVLEEQVIPGLFANRGSSDAIRVWVPGCATGEEVFSIAILLIERMHELRSGVRVQIFATDIDEAALAVARAARYPEALMDSVSEARRRRFFTYDDGGYVLKKEVRDLCVFSPHSVIRDPPFSRLDLVSCRNLLIYFGPDAQNQVLPTFHYALRPGGHLFLGLSENASQFGELFTAIDKKNRIFRRRDDVAGAVRPPLAIAAGRAARLGRTRTAARPDLGLGLRHSVEIQMLDRFAPAHVVVNREGDVVYYSAGTGKYLEASPGTPNRQLVNLARHGLRLDLRASLREAMERDRRVERTGVVVEAEDDRIQQVDLLVEPLDESSPEDRLFLVLFRDVGPMLTRAEVAQSRGETDENVAELERELTETREQLQSLIEEYETALEELKSSNEELVSINEEVQSSNEELEASKEELQSLNEELHTINAELHSKVDQLDRANSDISNLFDNTNVAIIFLDKDLVIRSFTPAASQIFRILPSDRGRPLTDLASRVSLPTLTEDVAEVLQSGQTVERSLEHEPTGGQYLLRLAPYRDSGQTIAGVVFTFVDVTSVAQAEAHQKVLIAELNHRVKNMLMVVISIAELTYKDSRGSASFKDRLVERVNGMARSYELIARENWTETSIGELVSLQLAPFGADRLALDGPDVRLKPKRALSLGMVLHELATNAAKYGALSHADGRLELTWSRDAAQDDGAVNFIWRETGGPTTRAPDHKGFGLKLIEREVVHTLNGSTDLRFGADGFRATLVLRPD